MAGARPASSVRRRCAALVRELGECIPAPFDLHLFLERLQRHRAGRSIQLLALASDVFPTGQCGLWVKRSYRDVIGYPVDAPRAHRDHIVLHEVGHVVGEHEGTSTGDAGLWAVLLPDLDPAMVRTVLGRSVYDDAAEQEAELFASLIMQRALSTPTTAAATAAMSAQDGDVVAGDDPVALRVRATFGSGR